MGELQTFRKRSTDHNQHSFLSLCYRHSLRPKGCIAPRMKAFSIVGFSTASSTSICIFVGAIKTTYSAAIDQHEYKTLIQELLLLDGR
jgi:hypothetical protein